MNDGALAYLFIFIFIYIDALAIDMFVTRGALATGLIFFCRTSVLLLTGFLASCFIFENLNITIKTSVLTTMEREIRVLLLTVLYLDYEDLYCYC
jgi:hypothetical protein